ncbi:type II inositol polyphosphate 5-phosphatase 15-like isoform X1 [Zingiber officinale]|uniref:type II inositol polyphosphate 5-phosphatase 15-like isoform X1 n=1 Tax=Zingiber officinale TaxID=94328 RepID=UPI001C4D0078|nr:type II inositol polyphosphate 5-phosphatase 15-like isoform X1 [Zingiber officinale]
MEQSLIEDDDDDWSFITDSFATAASAAAVRPAPQPLPSQGQPTLGLDFADDAPNPFGRLALGDPPSTSKPSYSNPCTDLPAPDAATSTSISDRGAARSSPSASSFSDRLSECTGMDVHWRKPPAIELRPHPLRETQVGCFIRTIAASGSQVWAGLENGVRVWNVSDAFEGFGRRGFGTWKPKRGDEESAPFEESCFTSPTICLVVDPSSGLVFSGHKDGRIRIWRMESEPEGRKLGMENGGDLAYSLSWQAHRSPVLSMTLTSHGELWSGSEGGVIIAWSWKIISKALSLSQEDKQRASALVERSFVDLRSLATVGGMCLLPTADIKCLLSDNFYSKVWSSSSLSFALWDANTKELLKVFNIDGQVETRFDTLQVQNSCEEVGDMRINLSSTSKKAINFFQRSRHVLLEAAGAVRKAAAKSAFGDDYRRTEALTITVNGMIWSGCANGLLIQWDRYGHRLQEVQHHSSYIQCLSTFGTRLWIGYMDGTIQVIDIEGKLLGGWIAHRNPIIGMAVVGSYLFTLANHGGIRGWHMSSPGPLDSVFQSELSRINSLYTRVENFGILVGSWNVGQERVNTDSLISWLGNATPQVGLVVVGLQEVEMGAGFLAMAAAKETVGLEGSANGQWWLEAIGKILDDGVPFELIGSRQLAGLLIAVWARKNLRSYIGDVDAAAVPCGFGRAIGNKGAVALRMRIYDQKICFINCHFAAHLEAVNRRNADFDHVFRTMTFSRISSGLNAATGGACSVDMQHGVNINYGRTPELSEANMVVFLGDFNYRLEGITYEEAVYLISQRRFDLLLGNDQLQVEMKAGRVFQGFQEGKIKFPPTYKFEKDQTELSGYDLSEKKRIPAWCDRILFRDSRNSETDCSLACPVVSSILMYDSCMDVKGSDHKPVKGIFTLSIAHVDEITRRQKFGEILVSSSLKEEFDNIPETSFSSNDITLQGYDITVLRVTNKCRRNIAIFQLSVQTQASLKESEQISGLYSRCSFGFPDWLEVNPKSGTIKPGQIVELSMHYKDTDIVSKLDERTHRMQQNWQDVDSMDKVATLRVDISSNYSTEVKNFSIHIRHRPSSMSTHNGSRGVSTFTSQNFI